MTGEKYQYKVKSPFGEDIYRSIDDIFDFMRLFFKGEGEIIVTKEKQK